jgi:two-component system, cell cycle sensor histidine kinase and response regulator CckA
MLFPRLTLKTRVTILFPLAITLAVGSLLFLIHTLLQSYIKESISTQQYQIVSLLAEDIDRSVAAQQQTLIDIASTLTREMIRSPQAALTFLKEKREHLADFNNGMFLFDPQGKMIAELPLELKRSGTDFSYRDYLQQTLATRKPFLSDPYVSSQNHHPPAIMFTAPVVAADGSLLAILGGSVDLGKGAFLGRLARVKFGESGYLFLFNHERLMVLHPDKTRIMQKDIPLGANKLLDAAIAGFDGSGETTNSRGVAMLTSFKHLQSKDWILGGNYPLREAYAPINKQKIAFLAIFPFLSLSIFWLTRRYLHHFTAPIVQLTDHVKSLPDKTGGARIFPVQGGEEVAILGAAFNALIREVDWQQSELASRETLYRTVVDSSLEMVFWISADRQTMHYVSPSCQNVTGYACADFYRHPDLLNRMIYPLDSPRWEKHRSFAEPREGGIPQEFRIVTADGETRWVSHLCRLVYNEQNENIGVRGSFLDITLWKEAEAALFASEEKFRLFFEEASDAIFIIDRKGIILVANDEACLRYGFSHGEMIGRPLTEFDATEQSNFLEERIAEVMRKGAATFESKHRRKGAAPLPVEINARSILFEEKKVVLAVARDISERKRNVAHLRKLSVAVEQNPASIVITDINGIIEYVNPHFTALTGYTLDELVGKTPSILKSDETSREAYAELWQTILAGGEWRGEFHNRKKNGELYWEEALIAPIRDDTGTITHFIAIKEDISERKELEGQLRHAQKMEAIGQLAGGVAHDFNNILTAIIGYASIMHIKLPDGSPLKKSAEQIMETAERGASLTQGLLAFSRKQVSNPRVIDLNEILQRLEQLLMRLISEDISLHLECASRPLPIVADSVEIEQVLMNLATNARDALADGGRIVITTTVVTLDPAFAQTHGFVQPGDYARLTFSDSGQGMDEETVKRIFEPFYTTKDLGKGTGLGLSIAYGIIKKHHGYIFCHSAIGSGTAFQIYFPLSATVPENIIAPPTPDEIDPAGRAIILLAEDSDSARAMMQDILEEFGYVVLAARDGQEAIDLYQRHRENIDLLLLDVMMPKLKGREVYDAVRRIDPTIKALFCSGYDDEKVHCQGGVASDMNFLSKPFTPKELLMKIREVLHAGK